MTSKQIMEQMLLTKLLVAGIILAALLLVIITVPSLSSEPQQKSELPSIPVNKGIFCSQPGETNPEKCRDTRP
jgi:uncharacterized membrane protein YdfJ with MMPL/SSD domain